MILALVPVGVLALALALWGRSDAATPDVAAASVDPAVALVGQPVTFTSTNACTTACSLTWRRPDIGLARFGGVIVGRGEQFTMSFDTPDVYQVVLDMGETCAGTTQLVCHSFALVIVDVVTELPVAVPVPPDPTLPPDTTLPPVTTLPATTLPATTLPPETTVAAEVTLPPETTVPPATLPAETTVPAETTLPADPTPPSDSVSSGLVAPNDLTVTSVGRRNRLTWTDPASTATSLILERCKGTACTSFKPVAILDLDTTSFIESRMRHGSEDYSYRIAASDDTGTVYSNIVVSTNAR